MRWRPLTWALLSVCCFVAAVWFWRFGDERAARLKTASPAQSANPSNQSAQPASPAQPATASNRPGSLNPAPASRTPAPAARSLDPLAYRLANTSKPFRDLVRSDTAVLLENALLDTTQPANLPIPDF